MTVCSINDVCIFNDRLDEDFRVVKPTCKHDTLMDYVIGSLTILRNIQEFLILVRDALYSGIHCGIHVELNNNVENTRNNYDIIIHETNSRLPGKWSASKKSEYKVEIN